MPKPKKARVVLKPPSVVYYKPRGVPLSQLDRVVLGVDEYEAIRLVDKEGLQQHEAAERMEVSRATCARILESAHRKIGDALTGGKAIQIAGGSFVLKNNRYRCDECGTLWEVPTRREGSDAAPSCPGCRGRRFTDLAKEIESGPARRGGRGRGRHRGAPPAR